MKHYYPLSVLRPYLTSISDNVREYVKVFHELQDAPEQVIVDKMDEFYKEALYKMKDFYVSYRNSTVRQYVCVVPGNYYYPTLYKYLDYGRKKVLIPPEKVVYGPRQIEDIETIFILGKQIADEDYTNKLNFCGSVGYSTLEHIVTITEKAKKDCLYYITNFVKWATPVSNTTQLAPFANDCFPLLLNELFIIKPKTIIYFMAPFCNKYIKKLFNFTPKKNDIRNFEIKLPDGETYSGTIIVSSFSKISELDALLKSGFNIVTRSRTTKTATKEIPYKEISTVEEMKLVRDRFLNLPVCDKLIALDCEWTGKFGNTKSRLTTIQFLFDETCAYIIPVGKLGDTEVVKEIISLFREMLLHQDTLITGSFLYTDAVWLRRVGIDLFEKYAQIPTAYEYEQLAREEKISFGILDIAIAVNVLDETAPLGLCELAKRFIGVQPWDTDIEEWVKKKRRETKNEDLFYGDAPEEILYPYAAKDVLYTFIVAKNVLPLLFKDNNNLNSIGAYLSSIKMCAVIVDMMTFGIAIDRETFESFVTSFKEGYKRLLAEIRSDLNWPDFDPRKTEHVKVALFGRAFDQKGLLPHDARPANLKPIKITDKKVDKSFVDWDTLSPELQQLVNVSTDKQTCGILASQAELPGKINSLHIVDHALKNVLSEKWRKNIEDDGRIRSFIAPTTKTGRCRSSHPNMQNLSKRRDNLYNKLCGTTRPLRSILTSEKGYSLVECDFISAELFVLGVFSGEKMLIEHCKRSSLPDTHPDYYDVHSNLAVKAFRLDCEPTKKGLSKAGKIHLRTVSKSIIYGINYGVSLTTIRKQIKAEEQLDVSEEEVARIKDAVFETYPKLAETQELLTAVPTNPGYQINYFGRIKRFQTTRDPGLLASQQRESMNFPFQSTVAECLNLLAFRLKLLSREIFGPERDTEFIRTLLPWHDALAIEVKNDVKDLLVHDILPSLVKTITFKRWNIFGVAIDQEVYHMDMDIKVIAES